MIKPWFKLYLILLLVLVSSFQTHAATVQIPEWCSLSASLAAPPELGQPVEMKVTLRSLIGSLSGAKVRLILPESWKAEPETATIAEVKEGASGEIKFSVTPNSYLNQGSIVAEVALAAPKADLIARIQRDFTDNAVEMTAAVNAWPAETKLYADVAFALFADESFYPLSGDMWLSYDDSLAPEGSFRGPVFFEDTLISAHQAQTDVEMFDKLQGYLNSDPEFAGKLAESGIDIEKKWLDQLNGLYVLAVKAWQSKNHADAAGFIEQLEKQIDLQKSAGFENLKIATLNLKGLVFWSQGQKRLAEEALKKAFYANRKHSLQRYVLRNIGLLMLANGDRATASQMFNLALPFKQGFTLLAKEIELLKKN